jgi:hypothetical protein
MTLPNSPSYHYSIDVQTGLQGIQFLLLYPDGHLVPLRRYVRDFATNPWAVTGAGMHPAIFDEVSDIKNAINHAQIRHCTSISRLDHAYTRQGG